MLLRKIITRREKKEIKHCFFISISKESIIDVEGEVSVTPKPIESCTQKNVELQVKKVEFVMFFFICKIPGFLIRCLLLAQLNLVYHY